MHNPVCAAARRLETVAAAIRQQYQFGPSPDELPDERSDVQILLEDVTNRLIDGMSNIGLEHRISRIPE